MIPAYDTSPAKKKIQVWKEKHFPFTLLNKKIEWLPQPYVFSDVFVDWRKSIKNWIGPYQQTPK